MKTSRLVVALAATAMAVALLPLAGSAQEGSDDVTVEASRQVTREANPVRLFITPEIAVHPDNPNQVAMIAGDVRNGGCFVYTSRDGGLSWSGGVNVSPSENPFCLQRNFGPASDIVWAPDGTLYASFSGSSVETGHPNGPTSTYLARSSDGGQTFDRALVAEGQSGVGLTTKQGDDVTADTVNYLTNVTVDPNDSDVVYVGWKWRARGDFGFLDIPNKTQLAVSTDGGESFGEVIDLTEQYPAEVEDYFGSDTAMIAVDSNSTVHVVAQERPPSREAVEHLLYWRSTDQGATWTNGRAITDLRFKDIDSPDIAVDTTTDNLYVALGARTEPENEDIEGWLEPWFTVSTDGGESWSDARNLSTDPEGFSAYFPGISVAPNGRIDVAWHDFREDPFFQPGEVGSMGTAVGQKFGDIYYTFSTDQGANWSENIRVTDRSIDRTVGVTFSNKDFRGPVGIDSANGAAYITWADSRAADPELQVEDAYMTRVRHAPAAAAVATTGGGESSVLWSVLGAGAALALGGLVLLIGSRRARRAAPQAEPARVRGGSD